MDDLGRADLRRLAEQITSTRFESPEAMQLIGLWMDAATPSAILTLLDEIKAVAAERDRLKANQNNNLCRYPAIHDGDVELLLEVTRGVTQTELARRQGCVAPNIGRKIRRVKERIGWKRGMGKQEILARAQQQKDIAEARAGGEKAEAVVIERDQLRAEVEALQAKADCVDDCAHLIRKLVHCRRQLATDEGLANKALDYLKRKGLQGSPLRSGEGSANG